MGRIILITRCTPFTTRACILIITRWARWRCRPKPSSRLSRVHPRCRTNSSRSSSSSSNHLCPPRLSSGPLRCHLVLCRITCSRRTVFSIISSPASSRRTKATPAVPPAPASCTATIPRIYSSSRTLLSSRSIYRTRSSSSRVNSSRSITWKTGPIKTTWRTIR